MSATEKELAELHVKVANILVKKLDQCKTAEALIAEHAGELPEDVVEFLCEIQDASPALLTVATKFLKDNEITVNKDDSQELSDLDKRLKEKRLKRSTTVIAIKDNL